MSSSKVETYDYLGAANGEILLINCDLKDDRVLAGLVYATPGLPPKVVLCNPIGRQIGFIAIPDSIRTWQPQCYTSRNDDIEFSFTRY